MKPARLLAAAAALGLFPALAPAGIVCAVPAVELRDAFEGRQLLVSAAGRDVTREAKYTALNPAVSKVDENGYVTPAGDGTTTIRVEHGADRLDVPVSVTGFGTSR